MPLSILLFSSIVLSVNSHGVTILPDDHSRDTDPLLVTNCKTSIDLTKCEYEIASNADISELNPLFQPQQIFMSYINESTYSFTWLTFGNAQTTLQYGHKPHEMENNVTGTTELFVDPTDDRMRRFMHRVWLTDIESGACYYYRVGSDDDWSCTYSFVGMRERKKGGHKVVFMGDMGTTNAQALPQLIKMARERTIDMIVHNGKRDIGYDLHENSGKIADIFGRMIEPASSRVPYMVSPGNHDRFYNFTHYSRMFTMPGNNDNHFYSFDLGLVHFVALSTEVYYFWENNTIDWVDRQWNWLVNDLKTAIANRAQVPWIIVYGHKPMHCSDYIRADGYRCPLRRVVPHAGGINGQYGLERLLYDNAVDMYIGAHVHIYERDWPTYRKRPYKGRFSPYTDPEAVTYVTIGNAGCLEKPPAISRKKSFFIANYSNNYGYGQVQACNQTHLQFKYFSSTGTVQDSFWLIRNTHGNYPPRV